MALEDFKEKSLQVVKNGNMLWWKTINKEREKMLVLIMNEVETNSI